MKPTYALSIRQPWAWLICAGHKDIENRNWPTKFRGRIFVHASLSHAALTEEVQDDVRSRMHGGQSSLMARETLTYGAVIGEVDIVDCVTASASPWFLGKYGFVLANPTLYERPVQCKGRLGFFRPELVARAA